MGPAVRLLVLLALLAAPAPARANPSFDLAVALFADAEGGTSFDVDASVSPTAWLTLSAGVGTSDTSAGTTDFGGDALRASIDLHSQRFGLSPYFRNWSDDADFSSETLGVRPYFMSGGFMAALIAETRNLDVGFTTLVLGRPVARNASFESTGIGAGLAYYGARWGGYLEGVSYDYDNRFDTVLAASRSPEVAQFPRIQGLVGSILTLTQGAIDYELMAGIERMFSRSSVRLEWIGVEDAVDGVRAHGVSGTWRHSFTRFVALETTIGVSDSEDLDSLAYGGVALILHR